MCALRCWESNQIFNASRKTITGWPERGVRYVATLFSAKEAFSNAIGMGMRMPMTWRSCELGKLPSGQPVIVLHDALKIWFESQHLKAHISVTDEADYAGSYCIVEKIE
jgi:holo-[acyl-carrier-protein] synthase